MLNNFFKIIMSRKTVIKSLKNTAENKSFSAKAIPYQVLDEQAIITKALEDDKVAEKEKELLARELEKPYNKRNKALMNKYRGRVTEVLNGWPQDVSKGGYDITAVGVDDQDIPLEMRPQPWYAKLEFNAHKNKYLIKFPLKKESTPDGVVLYKLDGYNTWIYPDGSIVDSMSEEENVYTALKNYVEKRVVTSPLRPYLADPSKHDSPMTFQFPNFFVSYTQDKAIVEKTATHKARLQKASKRDTDTVLFTGSEAECKRLQEIAFNTGFDIYPESPIPQKECRLVGIRAGKQKNESNWLLFTRIDDVDGVDVIILSGARVAAEALGRSALKTTDINELIKAQNKKVLDWYREKKKNTA